MSHVWCVVTRPQVTTTAALPARAARFVCKHTHTHIQFHSHTHILYNINCQKTWYAEVNTYTSYIWHVGHIWYTNNHLLQKKKKKVQTQTPELINTATKTAYWCIYLNIYETCQSVTSALILVSSVFPCCQFFIRLVCSCSFCSSSLINDVIPK